MVYKATKAIAAAFDDADIKYDVIEASSSSAVKAGFRGENVDGATVHFISSDDDSDVKVVILSLLKVPSGKRAKMLETVNALNAKYRYLKFLIDTDGDMRVEYDFPLRTENVGPVAVELFMRTMSIVDGAYPDLMKSLWG